MSSLIDGIKSLRVRALGLDVTHARIDEIQKQHDSLTTSLQTDFAPRILSLRQQQDELRASLDPLLLLAAEIEDLRGRQDELSASLAGLCTKLDAQAAAAARELKPNQAIRIAFLVQHPSVWPSWRSVWKTASKDPKFSASVVLTPFIHPFASEASTYDDMRRCLNDEGVPFCTADYFDPASSRPHVVFVQNPYEDTRPEHLKIEYLKRAGCRVAYIPYGLELGGGAWNITAQFDTPLHRSAWRIFARSERSKDMFGKYCRSGNSHVAVTGHPKFDGTQNFDGHVPAALVRKIAGRKVILWTPHFSVGASPTWGTFKAYGESILAEMRRRTDMFLLMRPHPLFFKAMRQHNEWNAQQELDFRKMLNGTENFALDEAADYRTAFSLADALMADVGSFLLEFLPTGKPLLYLHCDGGLGMNDDGKIVEYLYTATDPTDITGFIEMVCRSEDPQKDQREAVVANFLFGLDLESTAGERICEHIHGALTTENDWSPRKVDAAPVVQSQPEDLPRDAHAEILFPAGHQARRNAILKDVLVALPDLGHARGIDIECGDGAFTLDLAKHLGHIVGHESDYALAETAKQAAADRNIYNVLFLVQELVHLAPTEKYDLISCMDVTSRVVDDVAFLSVIDKFKLMAKSGGVLLLSEILSTRHDQVQLAEEVPYQKFRSAEDFSTLIRRRGFDLRNEILISEAPDKHLVNKLFVFELSAGRHPSLQGGHSANQGSFRI